jgi:predicted PurR-regulated permease PerM
MQPAAATRVRLLVWVAVVIVTILALREFRDLLLPIVLSVLLFYALDPIVDRLSSWIPRVLATLFVLTAIVIGSGFAIYALTDETMRVVSELPAAARKLRATVSSQAYGNGTLKQVQEAAREIEKTASEVAGPPAPTGAPRVEVADPPVSVGQYVWWGSVGTAAALGQGLLVLFLTFFLIQSDDLYRRKLVRLVGPQLASKRATVQVLASIEEQIEQFLRVQIFTSSLVGLVTWLALWMLGVNQAVIWGVAAGVLNWIPYFGPLAVAAALSIIAWVQFGNLLTVVIVAGVVLAITTLEGLLLTPILLGRAARMNQVAVFVSLLFWSWVWGVFGTLLAIPIMMVVKVTCDQVDALRPLGELLGE